MTSPLLVYVSGKYSAPTFEEVDANIAAARKVAIEIWNKGHYALTPHLNTAHFEVDCEAEYGQYLDGDLVMLEKCDAMVLLPGHEDSNGARAELRLARLLGIGVYEYPNLPGSAR